jgi:hypothetical protein
VKARIVWVAATCVGLCACGHSHNGEAVQPVSPSQPTTLTLSVENVVTRAKSPSETDDPLAVNGGAVTVTPTDDETSDPVAVN